MSNMIKPCSSGNLQKFKRESIEEVKRHTEEEGFVMGDKTQT